MDRYVALLRGINVGGHRMVKMDAIKDVHLRLGHKDISTYLQSGNVVFRAIKTPKAKAIESAYKKAIGFPIEVLLLNAQPLSEIIKTCPIGLDPKHEAKFLHVIMLSDVPIKLDVTKLMAYEGPEEIHVVGDKVYVYYTDGSGRSKFTLTFVEKTLGLRGTARNWNTMMKLRDITKS